MKVGIALGSNLGDRASNMEAGFDLLRALSSNGTVLRSSLIETTPVDCTPDSGAFLNAAAEIDYEGSPCQLLEKLQTFERQLGRPTQRPVNSPRPLDLDILYFGNQEIRTSTLIIPHPRIAERDFVLKPLAEIRPELVLPGQNEPVQDLFKHLIKQ